MGKPHNSTRFEMDVDSRDSIDTQREREREREKETNREIERMNDLKELLRKLHDRRNKLDDLIMDIETTINKAERQTKLD